MWGFVDVAPNLQQASAAVVPWVLDRGRLWGRGVDVSQPPPSVPLILHAKGGVIVMSWIKGADVEWRDPDAEPRKNATVAFEDGWLHLQGQLAILSVPASEVKAVRWREA